MFFVIVDRFFFLAYRNIPVPTYRWTVCFNTIYCNSCCFQLGVCQRPVRGGGVPQADGRFEICSRQASPSSFAWLGYKNNIVGHCFEFLQNLTDGFGLKSAFVVLPQGEQQCFGAGAGVFGWSQNRHFCPAPVLAPA